MSFGVLPYGVNMAETNRRKATQTKNIIVRCSPREHEIISEIAKASDQTITQLVLCKALNKPIRSEYDNDVIDRLMDIHSNLSKIGNLFKLYISQNKSSEDFNVCFDEFKKVFGELKETLERKIK